MLGKEQQIFLSYSSSSKSAVKELVGDLQDLGHRVWFDQELNGGQDWWDQICTSIEKCKFFILAVDPKSLNSEACEKEWVYAQKLGKPVLAVQITKTPSIPASLRPAAMVDYVVQDHSSGIRLASVIAKMPSANPVTEFVHKRPEIPLSYLNRIIRRIETEDLSGREKQNEIIEELAQGIRDDNKAKEAKDILWGLKENGIFVENRYLKKVIPTLQKESPEQWPVLTSMKDTGISIHAGQNPIVRWLGKYIFERSLISWLGMILPLSWAARCLWFLIENPGGSEEGVALVVAGIVFFLFVAWIFYNWD